VEVVIKLLKNKQKKEKMDKKQEINKLKKELAELQEEVDDKDQTKGLIGEYKEEDNSKFSESLQLEMFGNRAALFRDYTKEGANSKLKRLIR
jgi:hypothetical protein